MNMQNEETFSQYNVTIKKRKLIQITVPKMHSHEHRDKYLI